MFEYMNYQGQEVRTLVVFPQVAAAILRHRAERGLPAVPIKELEYGLNEVMQIVNLLDADLLTGDEATIRGLLSALRSGYDIIWLITHAEEEGWFLNDGLVNASETTQLVRASGTFLTVMNTCSSLEVARAARNELGTAFICTVKEVPDRQAFITGVLFAQKLADGYDYVDAFRLAQPGQNSTYRLLEARTPMPIDRPQPFRRGDSEQETLARVVRYMEELDAIINGNDRLGLPALKDVVKDLQTDLRLIRRQLEEIQERQRIRNVVMWGMGWTIAILVITVALLGLRLGGIF